MIKDKTIKIYIGADFAPTKFNEKVFCDGDIRTLIGEELHSKLLSADLNIFNLEVPLTDFAKPIIKSGPNLIAGTMTINSFTKIPNLVLGIANNHIMDQDIQGLVSTIYILNKFGIKYVGAGKNLSEASRSIVLKIKSKKIGVYACTEHEFSTADESMPGANPFDPLESYDNVQQLKQECDYVIILYHGGKEYYRYPSPNLQKYCRKFVEKGADLIVCQHTHCIGCRENYKDGVIVYGQGNFLLDFNKDDEFAHSSLLLEVSLGEFNFVNEIPITNNEHFVKMANKEEAGLIIKSYTERGIAIADESFVRAKYKQFADSMIDGYLNSMLSKNLVIRIVNRLTRRKLGSLLHSTQSLVAIYNFIFCEAHRELLLQGLKSKYLHSK